MQKEATTTLAHTPPLHEQFHQTTAAVTLGSTADDGSVASTIGTSLTGAEFAALGIEELIKHLASRKVDLLGEVQQLLRTQMIGGAALSVLSQADLERQGIPAGVAALMLHQVPGFKKTIEPPKQWQVAWLMCLSALVALAAVVVWAMSK